MRRIRPVIKKSKKLLAVLNKSAARLIIVREELDYIRRHIYGSFEDECSASKAIKGDLCVRFLGDTICDLGEIMDELDCLLLRLSRCGASEKSGRRSKTRINLGKKALEALILKNGVLSEVAKIFQAKVYDHIEINK